MNSREKELEKQILRYLQTKETNISENAERDGLTEKMLLQGAEVLAHVTDQQEYEQQEKRLLQNLVSDRKIQMTEGQVCALGNAMLHFGGYETELQQFAGKLGQRDVKSGREAYKKFPFFMAYETQLGGKERYNEILLQSAETERLLSEQTKADHVEQTEAEHAEQSGKQKAVLNIRMENLAFLAAAMLDTMEVMEQPVYEVYHGLQDIFREALTQMEEILDADWLPDENRPEEQTAGLLAAYAIWKGCRMKAVLTEKHAFYADRIWEKVNAAWKMTLAGQTADQSEYAAAGILAYAESIRNREFQDYGRQHGGVLWS